MVGVRGQYVMVPDSSNLPNILLALAAVAAAIMAYRYFSKKPVERPAKRGIVKPAQVYAAPEPPPEPKEEGSGYFPLFAPAPVVEVVPVVQQAPVQYVQSQPTAVMPMQSGSMGMQYAPSYGAQSMGG